MEEKYFLHRIQEEGGVFSKGIEIHDTLDAAILSFWGRIKLGYNNPQKPNMNYVSCKIKDINGNVIAPYNLTWTRAIEAFANKYFMHHVRYDGDTPNKDIDICDTFDAARVAFASAMEYGYNNPNHSNVKMVSCEITDIYGNVMTPFDETWLKPEPEPEPEA